MLRVPAIMLICIYLLQRGKVPKLCISLYVFTAQYFHDTFDRPFQTKILTKYIIQSTSKFEFSVDRPVTSWAL